MSDSRQYCRPTINVLEAAAAAPGRALRGFQRAGSIAIVLAIEGGARDLELRQGTPHTSKHISFAVGPLPTSTRTLNEEAHGAEFRRVPPQLAPCTSALPKMGMLEVKGHTFCADPPDPRDGVFRLTR